MSKYVGILISMSLISCMTNKSDSSSKDIGMVNTQDAKTKVVYEEQGKVYLKNCKPPLAPPLDRNCTTDETPKYLESKVYLYKLPFDVGPYQRDAQGLALVTKALKDANDAIAGGNQNAASTVLQLTPIELNLKKILAVKEELQANHKDLTYYQYQDEFSKLLVPFSESAGGSTSISGMNFIQIPGQGFAMQETEVTRGQWKALMGYYPEANDANCTPRVLADDHPVSCVSATDAKRFADEMTRKSGGPKYRLPSEQEWEAAAGNIDGPVYGWCSDTSTHPVKEKDSNGKTIKLPSNGLYDMVGNVFEWTSSNWDSASSDRVLRGGGWLNSQVYCRASYRIQWGPDRRGDNVGFRLLRQP